MSGPPSRPFQCVCRSRTRRHSRSAVEVSFAWIGQLNLQLQTRQHRFEKILFILFILTIPLLNPWVRGDGVGYYAYARAPLIEHNLDFTHDYQSANESFRQARCDENGQPKAEFRTTHRAPRQSFHCRTGDALVPLPFAGAWRRFTRKRFGDLTCPLMAFPLLIAMPWLLQQACTDFSLCCSRIGWPANT